MKRLFLALMLSSLIVAPVWPQDSPPAEKKAPEVVQWVIAPEVVHKNIHFILDRSGSMNADQLASALGCFLMIAEQSVDEINMAITVFGENAVRWEGVPDERTPRGWASMPSQTSLEAAREWLTTVEINSGSTCLHEALNTVDTKIVERLGGDIDEITVIVISDLLFDNYPSSLLGAVNTLRKARSDNNAHELSFGFVGIRANAGSLTNLRNLSRREGFWLAYIGDSGPTEEVEEELPNEPLPDPAPQQQQLPDPYPLPPLPPLPDPLPDPSPY